MDGLEFAVQQKELTREEAAYLCLVLVLLLAAFVIDAWNQWTRRYGLVR